MESKTVTMEPTLHIKKIIRCMTDLSEEEQDYYVEPNKAVYHKEENVKTNPSATGDHVAHSNEIHVLLNM